MKFEIFKFKNVTSTNDIAINLIREKNKEAGCVCAEKQTKGRGTHGKKWISEKGNMFGSIFFCIKENYPSFKEFDTINPVLISDVIGQLCQKQNVSLKRPNDIFVNKKKICGILQEIITSENKQFLIVGIGVNVVSNPNINDSYKATNILFETEKIQRIEKIINLIISSYEKFFNNLNSYNYLNFKKKADLMLLRQI